MKAANATRVVKASHYDWWFINLLMILMISSIILWTVLCFRVIKYLAQQISIKGLLKKIRSWSQTQEAARLRLLHTFSKSVALSQTTKWISHLHYIFCLLVANPFEKPKSNWFKKTKKMELKKKSLWAKSFNRRGIVPKKIILQNARYVMLFSEKFD